MHIKMHKSVCLSRFPDLGLAVGGQVDGRGREETCPAEESSGEPHTCQGSALCLAVAVQAWAPLVPH